MGPELLPEPAQVAELVDALVSGTSAERRGGSSPLLGTNNYRILSRRHYVVAAVSVRSKAAITGGLATHKQSLGTYLKNKVQGLT